MNLRTPYDVFWSSFHTNQRLQKEYGKDYMLYVFYDSLIKDKTKLLDEGKLGGKHQAHLFKIKGNKRYKEREHINVFGSKQECLDQKTKFKTKELSTSRNN